MFGPTTGDRVRLADTELIIEVERDLTIYGEEVKFGGGKVIRDGMGQSPGHPRRGRRRHRHHQRADHRPLGHREGRRRRSATAASPPSARPAIRTSSPASTSSSARAPRSSPARARSSPPAASTATSTSSARSRSRRRCASGVTTMLGGGTGPATGTNATTCTPGPWHIARMLQAAEGLPVNLGFSGKGNASRPDALIEQIARRRLRAEAARGLGHHAGRDRLLPRRSPTRFDVQVMIHTDTLNESGFVEDTIAAFKGRTIHAFHTEGAGGGHAPDIIKVGGPAQRPPVLDQPDAALHRQHARRASRHADGLPSPRSRRSRRTSPSPRAASAARPSRPRTSCTTSARFSMISSDSQAMGRVGEVIIRTWQTAHKMKLQRGRAGRRDGDERQCPGQALRRQIHDQPGDRAGPGAACRLDRGRQAGRPGAVVAGLLRREAGPGAQGRHDRRRRRWATPTPRSRRRSRCITGRCSAPSAGRWRPRASPSSPRRRSRPASAQRLGLQRDAGRRSRRTRRHRQGRHDPQRRDAR